MRATRLFRVVGSLMSNKKEKAARQRADRQSERSQWRPTRPTRRSNRPHGASFLPASSVFKFLRRRGVSNSIFAQIKKVKPQAVLDFAFAEIVKIRSPVPVLAEIVGDMFGDENV